MPVQRPDFMLDFWQQPPPAAGAGNIWFLTQTANADTGLTLPTQMIHWDTETGNLDADQPAVNLTGIPPDIQTGVFNTPLAQILDFCEDPDGGWWILVSSFDVSVGFYFALVFFDHTGAYVRTLKFGAGGYINGSVLRTLGQSLASDATGFLWIGFLADDLSPSGSFPDVSLGTHTLTPSWHLIRIHPITGAIAEDHLVPTTSTYTFGIGPAGPGGPFDLKSVSFDGRGDATNPSIIDPWFVGSIMASTDHILWVMAHFEATGIDQSFDETDEIFKYSVKVWRWNLLHATWDFEVDFPGRSIANPWLPAHAYPQSGTPLTGYEEVGFLVPEYGSAAGGEFDTFAPLAFGQTKTGPYEGTFLMNTVYTVDELSFGLPAETAVGIKSDGTYDIGQVQPTRIPSNPFLTGPREAPGSPFSPLPPENGDYGAPISIGVSTSKRAFQAIHYLLRFIPLFGFWIPAGRFIWNEPAPIDDWVVAGAFGESSALRIVSDTPPNFSFITPAHGKPGHWLSPYQP